MEAVSERRKVDKMKYLQERFDRLNASSTSRSLLAGLESLGFLRAGVGLGRRVGWPI
jgi:hypothetical protein